MPDNEQTKVCPLCAETIKAAAKVCPYCRKSQRRWVFLTRYEIAAIVFLILIIGTPWLIVKIFYQPRDFASDRDKIRVTDFHFVFDKNRYETNVAISGILTNESGHSWDIYHFQVRYFNSTGQIAEMDDAPSDKGFTVMPHGDHSFHLTLDQRKSVPPFATCKIKVVSASDPRAPINIFD